MRESRKRSRSTIKSDTKQNSESKRASGFLNAQMVTNSRAYQKAQQLSSQYKNNPKRLNDIIRRAATKAQDGFGERFTEVKEGLQTFLRLLKAYASGEYRSIPWRSLSLIITSVLYFIMPMDFIPDFLATLGLLDDGILIAWTLKYVKEDLDNFIAWESNLDAGDEQEIES